LSDSIALVLPVVLKLKNEGRKEVFPLKCLLIVYSYHHNNTQKVAEVMAKVLDAEIKTPQQTNPEELQNYDLVGFGSGLDTGKNYPELLDFASKLSQVVNKKAFVFSTSGMPIGVSGQQRMEEYTRKCHTTLKETLQSKGYLIVDEFGCAGFNTNKFLKYFGGLNKGRPNSEDLKRAEAFAEKLKA
jgi:flavodoxin